MHPRGPELAQIEPEMGAIPKPCVGASNPPGGATKVLVRRLWVGRDASPARTGTVWALVSVPPSPRPYGRNRDQAIPLDWWTAVVRTIRAIQLGPSWVRRGDPDGTSGTGGEGFVRGRSFLGGFAARLVAQRRLVGGVQLIARTRCARVGPRNAEVELAQFVHHRLYELGAPVAKQFSADP